jgi:hypothetical protein
MGDPLFVVPLDMLVYLSQDMYGSANTYRWRCDVNSTWRDQHSSRGSLECETEFSFSSRDRAVELAVEHLRHHHGLLPVPVERGQG